MASISVIVAILGNVISILVFLSPVGTFRRVVRKKSTESFEAHSYICTLLATSLWTFYGILKPGGFLIATVNAAGAFLQAIYVILYLIYAPKDTKIFHLKLVAILNVGCLGLVMALVLFVFQHNIRLRVLGLICSGLTLGMYASPLSSMKMVMKTRSVEFMPFFLSFFLFINAGVWTAYSVLVRDYYVGVPNAIGVLLGGVQLVLYAKYNKTPRSIKAKSKSVDELEEEGSAHLVGDDLEMGQSKEKTKTGPVLIKGISLPKTPVSRQHSLQKAHSLTSYELHSKYSLKKEDVENIDVNHQYA